LSLHWGTDGLTARVTVDSPLAQSAIERSLDRLQDQLVRAGVKVDSLEVALSGGQTRGQFMHQQPQWQRPQAANPLFVNEYRSPEFAAVVAPSQAQPEYVGSRGVNLFA
jgi:flagellar hook-length control protein FliK